MLQDEIKLGLCYIHQRDGKFFVRKVISIDRDKVRYEFMSGPNSRKGRNKFNECGLRSFAGWADSEIEEKDDYSYLKGFQHRKKYIVLSVHGYELLKCQEKKIKFYLRKEVIKQVDTEIYQFTTDEIEKRILEMCAGNLPEFMLGDIHTHCVVCGKTTHLTKHHVVPKKDLPYYPLRVKKDFSNLLSVCSDHHHEYEIIKEKVSFEGFTYDTAVKWMNHFIEVMKPRFMPKGWHVLTGLGRVRHKELLEDYNI
jgi:hypothetical protein